MHAVKKEKDIDTVFKLLSSEAGHKYRLINKIEGKLITFNLVDISL